MNVMHIISSIDWKTKLIGYAVFIVGLMRIVYLFGICLFAATSAAAALNTRDYYSHLKQLLIELWR